MRSKNKRMLWLVGMVMLVATSIAFAQEEDREGSKDHPLISRYPGSVIVYYDVKEFDEYLLPLGKVKEGKLTKSQKLEGKVTLIQYKVLKGRSALEVYRNYELALKKVGFEILFYGTGEAELGEGLVEAAYQFHDNLWGDKRQMRHMTAKLPRSEGDIYVSLFVILSGWFESPVVQLNIIEVKPMETGLVTVNAEALAKDIAKTGHVAVYGIYFDTGKADVKPESEPALKEIAKLLQQNPKLNLYVVGHTDNVGILNSNMELSKLRAEAVVKALISRHGIDSKRLHPVGVGPLAPVASNKTEEGRAKNRRVELVEQ